MLALLAIDDPHFQREQQNYENPVASRELLLELIQNQGRPLSHKEICRLLGYQDKEQHVGVKRRLRAMENAGQLVFNRFQQYAIAESKQRITGLVTGHRDGYGFLTPDDGGKDYFIPFHEMKKVFHGDQVAALVSDITDKKGRTEVRIVELLKPRNEAVIGRFFVQYNVATVIPDDARICQELIIPPSEKLGARHGQMVVAEIVQRPTRHASPVAKVIEVLGDHLAPGMEIQVALRNHDLPHVWPEGVIDETADLQEEVTSEAKAGRIDLRDLPLVTIDGEDARDFDDAVFAEPKKSGGWRLWVAIADVSHYVKPGTALDGEAINRGNSVYFPEQVIPMLPEVLSNGLCSLNPQVDRLCMVAEVTVSAAGKLSGYKFYPAVMNSHQRFTYTQVAAILEGDKVLREKHQGMVKHLTCLHDLYKALNHSRHQRGAIGFETEETRFIFNAERKIDAIVPVVRNDAHKIIEECMILANVACAKFIEKHTKPGLFRVHDKPKEEKYNNFIAYLAELGIQMPHRESPEPADYSQILELVEGRPDFELIQTMLLRSMKQAVYSHDNIGHFGLALEQYSHFTSPIRRYPDLVVHRVIKAILLAQSSNSELPKAKRLSNAEKVCLGHKEYSLDEVLQLGEHCSVTERRADEATRDVADWLKCEFMQDHVGDEFVGVISTVTNFGFFVRLQDFHIEGLVHIASLGRDYFDHDEKRMRLVGQLTGQKYHVGDMVQVKVSAVNLDEKKIDLALAGENAVIGSAKKLLSSQKKRQQKVKEKAYRGKGKGKPKAKRLGRNERLAARANQSSATSSSKPGGLTTRQRLLAGDIPDDVPSKKAKQSKKEKSKKAKKTAIKNKIADKRKSKKKARKKARSES